MYFDDRCKHTVLERCLVPCRLHPKTGSLLLMEELCSSSFLVSELHPWTCASMCSFRSLFHFRFFSHTKPQPRVSILTRWIHFLFLPFSIHNCSDYVRWPAVLLTVSEHILSRRWQKKGKEAAGRPAVCMCVWPFCVSHSDNTHSFILTQWKAEWMTERGEKEFPFLSDSLATRSFHSIFHCKHQRHYVTL